MYHSEKRLFAAVPKLTYMSVLWLELLSSIRSDVDAHSREKLSVMYFPSLSILFSPSYPVVLSLLLKNNFGVSAHRPQPSIMFSSGPGSSTQCALSSWPCRAWARIVGVHC